MAAKNQTRNTVPSSVARRSVPLFPLGRCIATHEAGDVLEKLGVSPFELIFKHQAGDWGTLAPEDKRANDEALKHGDRLLSAYYVAPNVKVWVITEADRSATTVLLPEEY